MTLLACIAKDGQTVAPLACVERQIEERCWCPKAPIAISEVSTGSPSQRIVYQLPVLRSRSEGMYRKAPEQRFAGPALRVHNGEVQSEQVGTGVDNTASRGARGEETTPVPVPIPQEAMKPGAGTARPAEPIEVPTPGSPAGSSNREEVCSEAPRVCRIADCGAELRSDNQSGMCGAHTMEARSIKGSRRLGVPRLVYPSANSKPRLANQKETVVPIKPEAHPLAQVIDSPLKLAAHVDPEGIPLPDVKVLPHAYLVECVQEARRRLQELDPLFVFTSTAKEA